jgi:hypothetical protein
VSSTEATPGDPLSNDATHSTYTEGDDELIDTLPAPGPRTTQERGVPVPAEGSTDPQSTRTSTKSSTSSSSS